MVTQKHQNQSQAPMMSRKQIQSQIQMIIQNIARTIYNDENKNNNFSTTNQQEVKNDENNTSTEIKEKKRK